MSTLLEVNPNLHKLVLQVSVLALVVPYLPFKLGEPGSILGWISTQGLKTIEEKELPLH
jgi:hypothetical protein